MLILLSPFSTEDLDRLLGERPEKLRSLTPYTKSASLTRATPAYTAGTPAELRPACHPIRPSQYAQQSCYLPPAATHPSNSFALYSPSGQQLTAGDPSVTGSLSSPVAGKMPPVYNHLLQAEYTVGPRSMQGLLLEGDTSYDIDTLNPSLTDLQLQGKKERDNMMDSKTSRKDLRSLIHLLHIFTLDSDKEVIRKLM